MPQLGEAASLAALYDAEEAQDKLEAEWEAMADEQDFRKIALERMWDSNYDLDGVQRLSTAVLPLALAAVAQAIEETMVDVTPEVKTRISALWSMANIVTLTGLLGTITGLINTFAAVGGADPAERQEALSDGIAEAMYNTAYGLGIALLCMIAHLLLSTASKRVMADLEGFSLKFENMLGDKEETKS